MTIEDVKTIEDLDTYYDKRSKFYLEEKPETIADIVKVLFHYNYNNTSFHCAVSNKPTYYKNNNIQSKRYKGRSIHDYLIVCKNYFPEKKVKDFIKEFYDYFHNINFRFNNSSAILFRVCPDINKSNLTSYTSSLTKNHLNERFVNHKIKLPFSIKPTIKEILDL